LFGTTTCPGRAVAGGGIDAFQQRDFQPHGLHLLGRNQDFFGGEQRRGQQQPADKNQSEFFHGTPSPLPQTQR
jgi:hypothetical protein